MNGFFDPIMQVATLLVTIAIPVLIWVADRRSGERLSQLQELQVEVLISQERLQRQRRRDSILDRAATTQNVALLRILWTEVEQFDDDDRRLLQATFRSNTSVGLPGAHDGLHLPELLDAEAIHDYVESLEARYMRPGYGFDGLLKFLEKVQLGREPFTDEDLTLIASVLTGACAVVQRPDHRWYPDVVETVPALAPKLLARVGRIPEDAGPLRMVALSGVLEGILTLKNRKVLITDQELHTLRHEVVNCLAMALNRDLSTLDIPSRYNQTWTTTETAAMLIEVVGWAAGMYDYLGGELMRLLPTVIRSVPEQDRPWGSEAYQVRASFEVMESSSPEYWAKHRERLEAAADAVGPWRALDDGS